MRVPGRRTINKTDGNTSSNSESVQNSKTSRSKETAPCTEKISLKVDKVTVHEVDEFYKPEY